MSGCDPIPYDKREFVSLRAAAETIGVHQETVRLWCLRYHIGRMVGGRWKVSRPALAMFVERDRAALVAYVGGDRASPAVRGYFERAGLVPLTGGRANG
ncbi:hypothetical protein [Salinarimonas soli]|uniref:Helix-turn-helix domain-containing protein n=1 Tax=Salinarimonas soli TaxID=1638099 RepID=A0A5B2VQ40_9HYPH|nr:hypothetical protein [Salinarimonas soli]KAA2241155.1 hypothetical protein F0L46_04985 [Salinarimonas soli]